MPADTPLLPPARLRAARLVALACVLLMLVVVIASAWLRLAQLRPVCADWPGCRSADLPVLASAAPALLGRMDVLTLVRATHRVTASTVLLLVIALVALALAQRPRAPALGRRALVMLALALALAVLGVVSAGSRSTAVLLGNLLGGFALLAVAWSALCGLHGWPTLTAPLARWAAAGALCWWLQAALGALAGARIVDAAPVVHLGLALLAGPWACLVGLAARHQGCAAEGRAVMVLALLQMLLGAIAALNAAAPALVLLHNTMAALGVALLFRLGSARANGA